MLSWDVRIGQAKMTGGEILPTRSHWDEKKDWCGVLMCLVHFRLVVLPLQLIVGGHIRYGVVGSLVICCWRKKLGRIQFCWAVIGAPRHPRYKTSTRMFSNLSWTWHIFDCPSFFQLHRSANPDLWPCLWHSSSGDINSCIMKQQILSESNIIFYPWDGLLMSLQFSRQKSKQQIIQWIREWGGPTLIIQGCYTYGLDTRICWTYFPSVLQCK
jgi:hypothetical protein